MTTEDVRKMRIHTKMLLGNYLTFKMKADQSGGSGRCRQCDNGEDDDICHILTSHMSPERKEILDQISFVSQHSQCQLNFHIIMKDSAKLTQYILDPTSLNLENRIGMSDPILPDVIKLCQTFCHLTDKERQETLKTLSI